MIRATDISVLAGRKRLLDGVSVAVTPGRVTALIGPNGAGKTTTIELLEGILRPSSGTILYLGEPLGDRFRREAGIQFQHTALQDFLTVREHLELFARLYPRARPIAEIMERCALGELAGRDARQTIVILRVDGIPQLRDIASTWDWGGVRITSYAIPHLPRMWGTCRHGQQC